MGWYRTGRISIDAGSKSVTGIGTDFIGQVSPGFALLGPDLSVYEVESVTRADALSLVEGYRGVSVVSGAFAIWQTQGEIFALVQETAELLNTFGALRQAFQSGALVGEGLKLKGVLNSPAELPATGQQVGDAYLIGTSVYVFSGAGGWKHSDIAGVAPRGMWDPAVEYEVDDLVLDGGSQWRRIVKGVSMSAPGDDAANWMLFAAQGARGPAGVRLRGEWSAGEEYLQDDLVGFGGAQYWRKIAGTTTSAPDVDVANWGLFAAKGRDGLGAVDTVNGKAPDSNGDVALESNVQTSANRAAFPAAGIDRTLYIARDSGLAYRWDTDAATYKPVGGQAGTFPFFLANGARSNIPLTSDNKLPFKLADGSTSNIPLGS